MMETCKRCKKEYNPSGIMLYLKNKYDDQNAKYKVSDIYTDLGEEEFKGHCARCIHDLIIERYWIGIAWLNDDY